MQTEFLKAIALKLAKKNTQSNSTDQDHGVESDQVKEMHHAIDFVLLYYSVCAKIILIPKLRNVTLYRCIFDLNTNAIFVPRGRGGEVLYVGSDHFGGGGGSKF